MRPPGLDLGRARGSMGGPDGPQRIRPPTPPPPMKRLCLLACAAIAATAARADKFGGLALTPPMGWNTWNTFAGDCNETLVRATADAMAVNGMRDAGYTYIVVDDCWAKKERDADGNLVADPVKFPSGMKALGDYLHS